MTSVLSLQRARNGRISSPSSISRHFSHPFIYLLLSTRAIVSDYSIKLPLKLLFSPKNILIDNFGSLETWSLRNLTLDAKFEGGGRKCGGIGVAQGAPTLRRTVPPGGNLLPVTIPFPRRTREAAALPLSRRELLTRRGSRGSLLVWESRKLRRRAPRGLVPSRQKSSPSFLLSTLKLLLLRVFRRIPPSFSTITLSFFRFHEESR